MFKIGEFSQLGQVSTRMLRHYDKLGLLVPSHTDEWTSYRYYTIDQLARLHRILALKDLGLSLSQIADLLAVDEQLPTSQLRGMLQLKQAEVARGIMEEQMRLRRISDRLDQIDRADQPSPYEIVVKSIAPLAAATVRATVPHLNEMGRYCEMLTNRVYETLRAMKIRPLQPELILYHATEYEETDVDVEAAIAVHPRNIAQSADSESADSDTVIFRQLPGHALTASLIYEGELRDIIPAVLELLRWVASNGYVPAGPMREIHLSGPAHLGDPDPADMVTELMLPIAQQQPRNSR